MVNPLADELQSTRQAPPCALVIFGATGDLTRRKLVPSLLGLAEDGLLPNGLAVVGFARRPKTDDEFRTELEAALREYGASESELQTFAELRDRITYLQSTFDDDDGYRRLRDHLESLDQRHGTKGNRLFYLATPPNAYDGILDRLREHGLSAESAGSEGHPGRFARVIIEKPFGNDRPSACALNQKVAAGFDERQVFRIDHYLGKETVQNILALRFANGIFEPLWNEKYVDHVQITVAESIGIGTRGEYFEDSGIIRDMIQNHLLQVLTLIAMEPPASTEADAVRDEKVKVLRAIRAMQPQEVAQRTVRAQYTRAFVDGQEVPGYREEDGVAPDSTTETYAAVRLEIDNWRWAGTPFFLRSAKRLERRVTEIAIHFKRPPLRLFGKQAAADAGSGLQRNALLIRVQPDEGVSLRIGSKIPGPDYRVRGVRMDFLFGAAFGGKSPDAYERLLLDAMIGDSTLFARRDEVEEAWRIVDSIVAGWSQPGVEPPVEYPAGSWGPDEADQLLGDDREWRRP